MAEIYLFILKTNKLLRLYRSNCWADWLEKAAAAAALAATTGDDLRMRGAPHARLKRKRAQNNSSGASR